MANESEKPEQSETCKIIDLAASGRFVPNIAGTCGSGDTGLTQPRSADVLRVTVKVPRTLDQAAKLKYWLDTLLHKAKPPVHRFMSNVIYQVKGMQDEADLERLQPFMAWQIERINKHGLPL